MEIYRELSLSCGGGFAPQQKLRLNGNTAHLFIGLGGAGIDAMTALKKEAEDLLDEADIKRDLRFLAVDTDHEMFLDLEAKGMPLQPGEYIEMYTPLHHIPFELLRSRPELAWLGETPIPFPAHMALGAAGCRAYGRVQLILHSADFFGRLNQLLYDLCFRDGQRDLQVHIFSSLSGGTGSGMFLDVCYLVRESVNRLGISGRESLFGYLFMPDVIMAKVHSNPQILLSNGYAALKELDDAMQYADNGVSFRQPYGNGIVASWDRAPVDLCYLISATEEGGLMHVDGYPYALSVVKKYILSAMTAAPTFGLPTYLAPILPLMPRSDVADGACRKYVILGADSLEIPQKWINTYLACGVYEKYTCFRKDPDTQAALQKVIAQANLSETRIIDRLKAEAAAVKYPDYTAVEIKQLGTGVIEKQDLELLRHRCERIEVKVSQWMTAPSSDAYITMVRKSLDRLIADPDFGPYAAVSVLLPHKEQNLFLAISEMTKRVDLYLEQEEKRADSLIKEVVQARDRISGLLYRRKAEEYLAVWRTYLESRQMIAIGSEMLKLFNRLKDDLTEDSTRFYLPLAKAFERLDRTMMDNRQYLETTEKNPIGGLICPEELIPYLEDEIAALDEQAYFAYWMDRLVAEHHDLTETDDWFVEQTNCFFMHHLFSGRRDTIISCLEKRYQTDNPNQLLQHLTVEILPELYKNADPGCWEMWDAVEMKELLVPNGEITVQNAGNQYMANLSGNQKVRLDLREGHIGMIRYAVGVPLYAFRTMEIYESAYEDSHRNGHTGFAGERGDLRKLPSLFPQSRMNAGTPEAVKQEVLQARALYDYALERGLLVDAKTGMVRVIKASSDWKEERENLLAQIRDCARHGDSFDAQMLILKVEEWLEKPIEGDIVINLPCRTEQAEPSSVTPNLTCDRFVCLKRCQNAVKEIIELTREVEDAVKLLSEVASESQEKQCFFDALLTGVIEAKGLVVSCKVESFGMEEKTVLSEPFMPYGRLPLYQAFLNYCLLYEGSKELIRLESEERMARREYRITDSLRMWRDRFEWMHLQRRVMIYPQSEQEKIIRFYFELVKALREIL